MRAVSLRALANRAGCVLGAIGLTEDRGGKIEVAETEWNMKDLEYPGRSWGSPYDWEFLMQKKACMAK